MSAYASTTDTHARFCYLHKEDGMVKVRDGVGCVSVICRACPGNHSCRDTSNCFVGGVHAVACVGNYAVVIPRGVLPWECLRLLNYFLRSKRALTPLE